MPALHEGSLLSNIKLYFQTLEEEDGKRAEGHVTLSHWEWFQLMVSFPDHLLATNFVRVTENLGQSLSSMPYVCHGECAGLDVNGPLLQHIVKVTESLGII